MLIGLPIIGGCFYMTMEELRDLTETPQVKLKPQKVSRHPALNTLHLTENRTLVLLSLRLRPRQHLSQGMAYGRSSTNTC